MAGYLVVIAGIQDPSHECAGASGNNHSAPFTPEQIWDQNGSFVE